MGLVNYIEVSARPDCIACRVSFPFSLPPFLLAAAAEKARVGVQLGVQLGARQEDEAEEESEDLERKDNSQKEPKGGRNLKNRAC